MTTPDILTTQDFAAKVRAKYPGSYDSLSDDELTSRIVQKYPEYKSQVDFGLSSGTRQAIRENPPKFPEEKSLNQAALSGMTGIPAPSFSPQQRQEFEQGRAAGSMATPGGGIVTAGSGVKDITEGNVARGGHKVISGLGTAAMPLLPGAAVAAPARFAATAGAAYLAGKTAKVGAQVLGGNEEQQQFSEDIGNLAGGAFGATTKAPFSLAQARAAILKTSAAATDSAAADLIGVVSPPAYHGLKLLRMAAKVIGKLGPEESGGLADIVSKHEGPISELDSKLADALSKANALPPEGPTAKLTDVPDLRVKTSQQAPANLLDRPKVVPQAKPQAGGEFKVVPPEGAPTPSGKVTPNMEIYNEPEVAPKALKPPTLLEQLKQWDDIRKIHSQLEDQIGQGQEEIQQWMQEHNKQTPGGKPKNPAQATFDKAKAEQGGHAGGGVSSVEELNRPGNNYVVSKSGNLTYHGKSFDPGGIPPGSTHVTALPDGTLRVNAGPKLNPVQEMTLKAALPKPAAGVPRVPTSDAELEELLMQSLKQARAKRAGAD